MTSENDDVDLDLVYRQLQEMDNKLERIKGDTHNLNRIQTLTNSDVIIQELKKAIGKSEVRAYLLHLTKDEIGASELSKKLGIKPNNLSQYMAPFLGNKGYIAEIQRGRERYFQRSELVDLVGFESVEDFERLIEARREQVGRS